MEIMNILYPSAHTGRDADGSETGMARRAQGSGTPWSRLTPHPLPCPWVPNSLVSTGSMNRLPKRFALLILDVH